jgi:hypothetical protein
MTFRLLTLNAAFLLLIAQTTSAQPQTDPEPDEKPAAVQEDKPERSRSSSRKHRARDIVAIGDDVVLAADDVAKDVVVIGGQTRIEGTVQGDLVSILGEVILGTNAVLERDLVVVAGVLNAAPTAIVEGERVVIGPGGPIGLPFRMEWIQGFVGKGILLGRPLPHQYAWSWMVAGVFLLIYVLLAALFPRPIQASVEALQTRPGGSLLAGFLALLLIIPLIILLIATVVGIIVVPFVICGFIAAFVFGKVAVYRYTGEQLGHQLGASILEKPLIALILGIILFYLLYTIPILGLIVWGAMVPLGIGAVLLATFKSYRSNGSRQAPPVPFVPVTPSGTTTPPLITSETTTVTGMPRVGFWVRLMATALDFVLIAIITALVFRRAPGFFIPLWVIYHIALWSWKGTTIGGIIVGIKIVRLDGTPINWAVAIVRCLAAFLSAAVVFLGFFWAGWSADRQAWHDKIAGTVIVKVPKGISLI